MKSLLYLFAILASFFLLLLLGALAGGFILFFAGDSPAFAGAVTGGVAGVCIWFRVVGYLVELEDIDLSRGRTPAPAEMTRPAAVGPALPATGVKMGNHMAASGIVVFLSSAFNPSGVALLVGVGGVVLAATGFLISLRGVESPSEDGLGKD